MRSYKMFLHGLLANMQEAMWWRQTEDVRLCPVKWSIPLGILTTMERCKSVYTNDDWYLDYLWDKDHWSGLPAESKPQNFGRKNEIGEPVVIIDYGH